MPKIDKSLYTKEEFRKIQAQRRLEKQLKSAPKAPYHIVCVKHGSKYPSVYANVLYNMCKRNTTVDFEFTCLTDDPKGLNSNINHQILPSKVQGWWAKPYMFSNQLGLQGTILYMDLDVVIANNIDKLFTYKPGEWLIIRDFLRSQRPNWDRYNSSVIRFDSGQLDDMWQEFNNNQRDIQKRFRGDQDYIWDWAKKNKPATLFPDEWIRSWKWEVRSSKEWAPGGRPGNRTFKTIETVRPDKNCCVTVFHGDPNPENCKDPFVVDNWR